MDMILLVFVGVMCLWVGMNILTSEERNKVFNKRPIEVVDVKKYNQFCGWLVIGFGVVAEITLYCMCKADGLLSGLFTIILIAESFLVVVIYSKVEFKMLKKR